jgi:SAM-dependent methyltransferase
MNPWEVQSDEQALLALAGISSPEMYRQDRLRRAEELRRSCRIQPSHRGFEIGSGDGTVARLLAPSCAFIDCNDISASFLEKAAENCRGVPNLAFHRIAGWSLSSLSSGQYDFGYSLNVFIHFNPYDIYLYLKEVRRLLKPHGRFYFDACTIGPQTRDLFHEHARLLRENPEKLRGFLSFNHPELIQSIVEDTDLVVDEAASIAASDGWLGFLVGPRGNSVRGSQPGSAVQRG